MVTRVSPEMVNRRGKRECRLGLLVSGDCVAGKNGEKGEGSGCMLFFFGVGLCFGSVRRLRRSYGGVPSEGIPVVVCDGLWLLLPSPAVERKKRGGRRGDFSGGR